MTPTPQPLQHTLSRVDTIIALQKVAASSLPRRQSRQASFLNALLSTAIFRCWPILLFLGAWATLITVLNHNGHGLVMQSTLLTVIGTVLGFVISYRTTSSFERYNEGRRLWSQITLASRTFARTVWFHVPNTPPSKEESEDEANARSVIEKKTVINLLEAFSVAIKHYLRGEDGIYYQDLYYLVKFLPQYALPRAMGTANEFREQVQDEVDMNATEDSEKPAVPEGGTLKRTVTYTDNLFTTSPTSGKRRRKSVDSGITLNGNTVSQPTAEGSKNSGLPLPATSARPAPAKRSSLASMKSFSFAGMPLSNNRKWTILRREDENLLQPAQNPPKYGLFDIFPFSLLVGWLAHHGKYVQGKKGAALIREQMHSHTTSHNLPLELSLYISSYIASLQNRKICDVPTTNTLIAALNQLVDSLTGLERILTSPIPFSYTVHLWSITIIFCLALPFQIWTTLKWLTIPGTVVIGFIFFGFLVAGEEIENPFGYDKNDLNLDHFTHNIIRNELRAVTSTPPPDPTHWAFVPENNLLFTHGTEDRFAPDQWIAKGMDAMQKSLAMNPKSDMEAMFQFGTHLAQS